MDLKARMMTSLRLVRVLLSKKVGTHIWLIYVEKMAQEGKSNVKQ